MECLTRKGFPEDTLKLRYSGGLRRSGPARRDEMYEHKEKKGFGGL